MKNLELLLLELDQIRDESISLPHEDYLKKLKEIKKQLEEELTAPRLNTTELNAFEQLITALV